MDQQLEGNTQFQHLFDFLVKKNTKKGKKNDTRNTLLKKLAKKIFLKANLGNTN